MEAFLARAAREWPAALSWETILVCGDVSAGFEQKLWLCRCPKSTARATEKKMEYVHEAALDPHGLGARLKTRCCGAVIAFSNSERLLGLVA